MHLKANVIPLLGSNYFPIRRLVGVKVEFDHDTDLPGVLTVTDGLAEWSRRCDLMELLEGISSNLNLNDFPPGVYAVQLHMEEFHFSELVLKK